MQREKYKKWMKWKERQGWDSEKISEIFSRKCVEEQKMERRVASIFGLLRFWITLVQFESFSLF